MHADELVRRLRRECADVGFDLVQAFRVGWYDARVEAAYRLPDLGGPDQAARLGVLIGNTRALWPRFLAALRDRPTMLESAHPLDDFVSSALDTVVRAVPVRCELRAAHELPPRRVAMQRLADVSGLAWLAPSHFNVHPIYGPWFALRAAIVADVEGPPDPPPVPTPCASCPRCCVPAFERASAAGTLVTHEDIANDWRRWLAVRDACPLGREHRYDDAQVRYHYTKDRDILRRLVEEAR